MQYLELTDGESNDFWMRGEQWGYEEDVAAVQLESGLRVKAVQSGVLVMKNLTVGKQSIHPFSSTYSFQGRKGLGGGWGSDNHSHSHL